jgi:hypothetical protein
MATPLDGSLTPKIVALIAKHGVSATYSVVAAPTEYDPTALDEHTGSYAITETDITVISTPTLNYENKDVDGDTILARDCYVFIKDYTEFTPATNDVFTIDSKDWKIVTTTSYSTGDLIAAWKLQLRKN